MSSGKTKPSTQRLGMYLQTIEQHTCVHDAGFSFKCVKGKKNEKVGAFSLIQKEKVGKLLKKQRNCIMYFQNQTFQVCPKQKQKEKVGAFNSVQKVKGGQTQILLKTWMIRY